MRPLGKTELSHRRPAALDRFWFGAPYYPEHWTPQARREDADRMAAAGFNMVRMAEFAWDRIEPREGELHFELFDAVIDELGAQDIRTMLCTPTATPPRWLTLKHADILRVDAEGHRMQHGSRQHCCHASPTFREYSRRITRIMAEHYQDNPNVTAWQTDNEINCHFSECHCDSCGKAFQDFLRHKFGGDIEELNAAWGTAFWAQTYDRFGDVPTPLSNRPAYENPAHRLDYFRFLYDTVAEFQHEQIRILRQTQPRWFIMHNGTMSHVDYRGLFGKDLDVLGYDVYPFFEGDPQQRWTGHCFNMDRARSLTGNVFVPEHQSGPGGQRPYMHDTPEPGELRLTSYTSIARGADSLLYFRWRTCRFGAEEYWCGILDHDNVPRRRYEEVSRIGAELRRIGPAVMGTSVHVECAVATGDVAVGDAHATYPLGLPAPDRIAGAVHRELLTAGYAVGGIHPADDLDGIRLYVVPHWALFDRRWATSLDAFARGGGVLVVGARTATRDLNNGVVSETPPGCLRELCGVTVEEYGRRNNPAARPLELRVGAGAVDGTGWYEVLEPAADAEVVGTWQGRHLDGKPAVTCRRHGKGAVVYVGTYLESRVFRTLLPELVKRSGLKPLWPAPPGVEVVQRRGDGRTIWFFLNHADDTVRLNHTPAGTDLMADRPHAGGELVLSRYGVAVIQE